jgi:hypothetical protein
MHRAMLMRSACLVLALLLVQPAAVLAQGTTTSSPAELARMADALKPGQWVWAPSIAPQGPLLVYVDLSRQVATVYRNGVRIAVSTISSGKPGHETPDGVFTILQKDANHHSSKYNNAPMYYQERLTWDGVALHAGGLPGYPESHGCIHLPLAFAKLLFGITDMGGTVIVAGKAGQKDLVPPASVLAPNAPGGLPLDHSPLPPGTDYRFQPDAAPSGPVSLVISRADQRAILLRDGVEIGRARIIIPTADSSTRVFTAVANGGGAPRWIEASLPGHSDGGTSLSGPFPAGFRAPTAFVTDITPLLGPGSTILVTSAPVLPGTTGKRMTVIASTAS